jgi:hypothetical protein
MGVPPISGIGPFCVLQAGVNPYPVSVIGILPLPESGGKDTKMTDVMNCVDKLLEKKITGYKQRMAVNRYGVYY